MYHISVLEFGGDGQEPGFGNLPGLGSGRTYGSANQNASPRLDQGNATTFHHAVRETATASTPGLKKEEMALGYGTDAPIAKLSCRSIPVRPSNN